MVITPVVSSNRNHLGINLVTGFHFLVTERFAPGRMLKASKVELIHEGSLVFVRGIIVQIEMYNDPIDKILFFLKLKNMALSYSSLAFQKHIHLFLLTKCIYIDLSYLCSLQIVPIHSNEFIMLSSKYSDS